jgi:hypothetical protein
MGMLVGSGGLPVGDDCGTGVPLLHRGGPVVRWLWVRTGTRWPRGVVSAGLGGRGMKRARVPWRRDYPSSPAVEAARFQDETEPYPRHWRAFPEPWRPGASIDPETASGLADAFDNLPST